MSEFEEFDMSAMYSLRVPCKTRDLVKQVRPVAEALGYQVNGSGVRYTLNDPQSLLGAVSFESSGGSTVVVGDLDTRAWLPPMLSAKYSVVLR